MYCTVHFTMYCTVATLHLYPQFPMFGVGELEPGSSGAAAVRVLPLVLLETALQAWT